MATATAYATLYTQGQERASQLWANLPVTEVIEAARKLNDDLSAPAEVLEWTLEYLASVMPESEFVEFCETL